MGETNDPLSIFMEVEGTVYQAYTRRDGLLDCERCDRHNTVMLDGCKALAPLGLREICSKNKWIWKEVKDE
jgi:hypothetical protein